MALQRSASALLLLAGALTFQPAEAEAQRVINPWSRMYEGIQYATGSDTSPHLMKAYAVRVSLKNPDVSIVMSPGNGSAALDVMLQTTPNFADGSGSKVA